MQEKNSLKTSEWSYSIDTDDIGAKPVHISISPAQSEIKALCRRLGVLSIAAAQADLTLKRDFGNRIVHIQGHLKADVTQACIATLEPVAEHIDETFEGWFADPAQAVSFTKAKRARMSLKDQEEQPMLEEHEDPEPIVNGKIDLGEFVTQYFCLSLNPYPRAVPPAPEEKVAEIEKHSYNNPFAALKDWKAKERKKDN